MLDVETAREKAATDIQDIVAPEPADSSTGGLVAEGELPAVSPGATADAGATASQEAFGDPVAEQAAADQAAADQAAADQAAADQVAADQSVADPAAAAPAEDAEAVAVAPPQNGIYELADYIDACEAAGTPDAVAESYLHGHTSAVQWEQPTDGRADMSFALKPGNSASQALRDFMAGLTLVNYHVIGVALELNSVLDQLGDERFDELFGSSNAGPDELIPAAQRLQISQEMFGTSFAAAMLSLASEVEAEEDGEIQPVIAAPPPDDPRVEELREEAQVAETEQPAPELIADELGILREEREQQFA